MSEYLPGCEPGRSALPVPATKKRKRRTRSIQRAWLTLPREENIQLNEYCASFRTGERKQDILRHIVMAFCEGRYVMLEESLVQALKRRAEKSGTAVDKVVDSMCRMGLAAMERQERI